MPPWVVQPGCRRHTSSLFYPCGLHWPLAASGGSPALTALGWPVSVWPPSLQERLIAVFKPRQHRGPPVYLQGLWGVWGDEVGGVRLQVPGGIRGGMCECVPVVPRVLSLEPGLPVSVHGSRQGERSACGRPPYAHHSVRCCEQRWEVATNVSGFGLDLHC